jgi:hypothetical protein
MQRQKLLLVLQLFMLTRPPEQCRRLHVGSISAPAHAGGPCRWLRGNIYSSAPARRITACSCRSGDHGATSTYWCRPRQTSPSVAETASRGSLGRGRWRCGLTAAADTPKNPRAIPVLAFIEPCLPSPADRPPSGPDCRMMVRRDPVGIEMVAFAKPWRREG